MTEAEFKSAVRPLLTQQPTPERKLEFTCIWMSAIPYHDADTLAKWARDVLYGRDEPNQATS